jgi:hypothetical protein
MPGWPRQLAIVLAGLTLALAILTTRLLLDGRTAFRAGAEAEQRGELTAAIRQYLDAGRLYVPGGPYSRHAVDRLDSIAVAAVTRGDYATARSAFEAERAAILGTRSFYIPQQDRLAELERRLARLLAASEVETAAADFSERAAWHAQRLAEHAGPSVTLVLLALAGLLTWVASTVLFLLRGLDSRLGLRRGPALLAASGFVAGLTVFLVCLRLA